MSELGEALSLILIFIINLTQAAHTKGCLSRGFEDGFD
jgi:hypothetical protein